MLSPELLLLGAAAGAFGLFLWVAVVGRDRPEAAFAAFADELVARAGIARSSVTIRLIGPAIGPHVGPGAYGAVVLRRA